MVTVALVGAVTKAIAEIVVPKLYPPDMNLNPITTPFPVRHWPKAHRFQVGLHNLVQYPLDHIQCRSASSHEGTSEGGLESDLATGGS